MSYSINTAPDDGDDFPGHLLHQAALWDNCELLLDLLRGDLGKELECQDAWGRTALHAAATAQDSQCLQALLEEGANPNAVSGGQDNFKTPLHTSAEHGFLSNVKQLVGAGADVMLLEGRALTATELALRGGHLDTHSYLMQITKERESAREAVHLRLRDAVGTGDAKLLGNLIRSLSSTDRKDLLNKTPHGTNSLLFKACEAGNPIIVEILLENGSDGRIHPVTKYSPLYISAYHGHILIVRKLLMHFPALVKTQTVEKWLPLHAACINGHLEVLDLLLSFNYPAELKSTFRIRGNETDEYEMAFDINQKDVSDQSCLYIATQIGNPRLIDILLKFKVPKKGATTTSPTSPTKGRVSQGIQGIISRLSLVTGSQPKKDLIMPVDVNLYSEGFQTPLHVAVKAKNNSAASALLLAGADANLPILASTSTHMITSQDGRAGERREESSALAEACKNRDLGMIDLLLKHGARDEDSKALFLSHDDIILGKLLTLKAYIDAEGTLDLVHLQQKYRESTAKKALAMSLLPTVPVNINWHGQRLTKLSESWVVSAGLKLNPRLRLAPGRGEMMGLQAITRLDLSNNQLEAVPSILFNLSSLVHLNLSCNKISSIQLPSDGPFSPRLQEFLLHENRIEKCPPGLFVEFPALVTVNLSNNKLVSLPTTMWNAPKLQDLNVSLNLIQDLPAGNYEQTSNISPKRRKSIHEGTAASVERLRQSRCRKSSDSVSHEGLWRRESLLIPEEFQNDFKIDNPDNSITSLNLSHNSFTVVPRVLSCFGSRIQRLNLSFNSLEKLGEIDDFPPTLRQLDLSHNKIRAWFSVSESVSPCGVDGYIGPCPHRLRFRRLDNLKTLLLSGNLLKSVEVSFDENVNALEGRRPPVWFPNLTMLDLSENFLTELGPKIATLTQLSVLNLSRNKMLTDLPPQLGLLSRIWNLNLQGCQLQEPIKSLAERKGSKTMDIVGYLKSVLEDARPYARMKLMTVGIHGIGKTTLLSLLRQEGTGKGSDTWAKRMGTTPSKSGGKTGRPMSTVGVDIGCLVLDKGTGGPITFRTWDFGGQREYYATHSYFLSKRSLYLVLWNICDGEKGVNEVHSWLVNIQARAPNSPVIIVGTHFDLVSEKFPPGYLDYLVQKIRDKFICISDPEKRGLPRILTSVEISCRSKYNIKYLTTVIYDAAMSLKTSNGKPLLGQRVPSKYIHLEEIVASMAAERKLRGQDPVLTEKEFKTQAAALFETNYGLSFRDDAEIMQACSFLHENGILLHYDDSTLRDLYFLDPQWLCDMLANVVTIREINPFAQGGSMRIQDLAFLFKGHSKATQDYILVLLSKFELAIPYDGINLLIPPLLPTVDQMRMGQSEVRVKLALRTRGWIFQSRKVHKEASEDGDNEDRKKISSWRSQRLSLTPLTRFLVLSYFPCGFWARLMSRILSDDRVVEILRHYFILPPLHDMTDGIVDAIDRPAEWLCWQTGIELLYGDLTLLRIREVTLDKKPISFMVRRDDDGELTAEEALSKLPQDESVWDVVDLTEAGLLEIYLPALSLVLDSEPSITLNPSVESLTKLLALAVEAIDNLLEDWYPSIGTRFVHTSEGKYLVTRLCPCPSCFQPFEDPPAMPVISHSVLHVPKSPRMSTDSGVGQSPTGTANETESADMGSGILRLRTGMIFEAPKPGSHGQSVGLNFFLRSDSRNVGSSGRNYYAWTVEHCILEAQTSKTQTVKCPKHGDMLLSRIAADILFHDLPNRYLLNQEDLIRKQLLGRGAFGFVFGGILKSTMDVAIKMFHPIDPGESNEEAQIAYKAAQTKWCRSPTQSVCRAYLAARGEIRVLYWVSHPNIVPLLGLLQAPLSIVMPRAPRGALDSNLADYSRSGDHVPPITVQQCIIQLAKALDYLHVHKIFYRDLKAENILVWSFPPPFSSSKDLKNVDLKLADYGISRCALPTGTKGFGGTEGFMAPEIIRFNGEEEYTEKVDIFSLGMVLYQLLSLKQPFDGVENIKESILEGIRPSLRQPELYPTYILDLMVLCWDNTPKDRPSAEQIIQIVSTDEFLLVRDVVNVGTPPEPWELNVVSSVGIGLEEVWASCSTGNVYSLKLQNQEFTECEAFAFIPGAVTAMCRVNDQVWMGDITSKIHIFQLEGERTSREVQLEPFVGGSLGACVAIQPVAGFMAVAFSSGRLFLLNGRTAELTTELGQAEVLHALVTRCWVDAESIELWTGESAGEMKIFCIRNGHVIEQETLYHLEKSLGSLDVFQVLFLNGTPNREYIVSYIFPGTTIYSWSGDTREIVSKVDISNFLPSSTQKSYTQLMMKSIRVTALSSTERMIFVGTTTGHVFVLGLDRLSHLYTLHPFSRDVRSFWNSDQESYVVGVAKPLENEKYKGDDSAEGDNPLVKIPMKVVVFGRNYVHPFDTKAEERRRAYALLYGFDSYNKQENFIYY